MFSTNLYVCEVEYWDELEEAENTSSCICSAHGYAKCSEEIEKYFGANNIISMKMFALEEGPVIIEESLANRFISGNIN